MVFRYSEKYIQEHDISFGKNLYNLTIIYSIRQIFERLESSVIKLVIDRDLQYLPWELMHDGNDFLCFKHYISRYVIPETNLGKFKIIARTSEVNQKKCLEKILLPSPKKYRLLIVSENGDRNDEVHLLDELVHKEDACKDYEVNVNIVGKAHEVLNKIYSGQDIIHWIGSNGFRLSDGILDINIIKEALLLPVQLVVLNSCETGLMDKKCNEYSGYQIALNGLNVLCTLTWITDSLGQIITSIFYKNVLAGKSFSESLQLAKKAAYPMPCWWGYILYTNPSARLR